MTKNKKTIEVKERVEKISEKDLKKLQYALNRLIIWVITEGTLIIMVWML